MESTTTPGLYHRRDFRNMEDYPSGTRRLHRIHAKRRFAISEGLFANLQGHVGFGPPHYSPEDIPDVGQ